MEFLGIHWTKSNILPFIISTTMCKVRNLLTLQNWSPWMCVKRAMFVRFVLLLSIRHCTASWLPDEQQENSGSWVKSKSAILIGCLVPSCTYLMDLGILCWIYPRSSGDWSFTVYGHLLLKFVMLHGWQYLKKMCEFCFYLLVFFLKFSYVGTFCWGVFDNHTEFTPSFAGSRWVMALCTFKLVLFLHWCWAFRTFMAPAHVLQCILPDVLNNEYVLYVSWPIHRTLFFAALRKMVSPGEVLKSLLFFRDTHRINVWIV